MYICLHLCIFFTDDSDRRRAHFTGRFFTDPPTGQYGNGLDGNARSICSIAKTARMPQWAEHGGQKAKDKRQRAQGRREREQDKET